MNATVASSSSIASIEDLELLDRLRRGEEAAFAQLVEGLYGSMLRLAMIHLGNRAVAEEVVQDAWVGVLRQLDRFEGRSSLRTWILRIVSNRAKTLAVRERRTVPFSSLMVSTPMARARSTQSGTTGSWPRTRTSRARRTRSCSRRRSNGSARPRACPRRVGRAWRSSATSSGSCAWRLAGRSASSSAR